MENRLDRLMAVMIGHAVGDALGVPVEFAKREELAKDPVRGMKGYGTFNVPAGAWSDDTSMSLCALDVLSRGKLFEEAVMINFGRWCYKDEFTPTGMTFDVGNICAKAINGFFIEKKSLSECGGRDEYSNGNGSLMRIHPYALFGYYTGMDEKSALETVENASALTHAHRRSEIACGIYTLVLRALLKAPEKRSVTDALAHAAQVYADEPELCRFARVFLPDFALLPEEQIRSSGYVVDTLEAALWCLLTTESYADCVLRAVNLGDDTDTVAAVAGGLAGALYGYSAIPEVWRETLLRRDYFEKLCLRADRHWQSTEN